MQGISIKPTIGIGDALQYSSLPENYYRATGKRLLDVSKPWFFDHNPFVLRELPPGETLKKTTEMWNYSPKQYQWPVVREQGVYLSNAEIHASVFGVPTGLNRPRLYKFEDHPYENRHMILLHLDGKSHGNMPEHIIHHILKKYGGTRRLFQIGVGGPSIGIPRIYTETLWELAEVISKSQMLIGMDSGPSWIAACYPDVIIKKVRTKPSTEYFKTWVPLSADNVHSHWDDRCHQIYNVSEEDVGFTSSYRKL